jgi:hypothetical protein
LTLEVAVFIDKLVSYHRIDQSENINPQIIPALVAFSWSA